MYIGLSREQRGLSLSVRFNGHFPGEPGLAAVHWSKRWWRWWWQLDNWSYKSCKAPVKSSPPANQHPVFLQAGCPSCRPTNSVKSLKGKYHIPWTCLPQAHLGVFQLCLWPLTAVSAVLYCTVLYCTESTVQCSWHETFCRLNAVFVAETTTSKLWIMSKKLEL